MTTTVHFKVYNKVYNIVHLLYCTHPGICCTTGQDRYVQCSTQYVIELHTDWIDIRHNFDGPGESLRRCVEANEFAIELRAQLSFKEEQHQKQEACTIISHSTINSESYI